MKMPPDFLQPLLHSIESIISEIHKEFPRLIDKDVEAVLAQMEKYYKTRMTKKDLDDPESLSEKKQALIDEILNVIDAREEMKADSDCIKNPEVLHGEHQIPSLEHLYIIAFKRLQKSVRYWRKKDGVKGYLTYTSNFL